MVENFETIKPIVNEYIADVKKAMPIDKVYLYGSYAQNTQKEDSDVDICFFSSAFEDKSSWEVLTELFCLKIKYDHSLLIEPNAFPTSALYDDNPFVKEILQTGIEL